MAPLLCTQLQLGMSVLALSPDRRANRRFAHADGAVRQVKVLGGLELIDQGELDHKILVISLDDPLAGARCALLCVGRHLAMRMRDQAHAACPHATSRARLDSPTLVGHRPAGGDAGHARAAYPVAQDVQDHRRQARQRACERYTDECRRRLTGDVGGSPCPQVSDHNEGHIALASQVIAECHESWRALKTRGAGNTGFWLKL